jgi:hypothetical protein
MDLGNLGIMQEALLVVSVITYVYAFRHTGDKLSVVMKIADAMEAFVSYLHSVPDKRFRVHDTTE